MIPMTASKKFVSVLIEGMKVRELMIFVFVQKISKLVSGKSTSVAIDH